MTTIAYDGKTMAGDSMISSVDGSYWASKCKVKKVDGHLVGCAGSSDIVAWFLGRFKHENLNPNKPVPQPTVQLRDEDLEVIVVTPKGKIYHAEGRMLFHPIKAKYIAIGGGEPVANGAMFMGATAKEAVKAAIKHSSGTGGKIHCIKR